MQIQQTSRDFIIEAFFILLKNKKIEDISIAEICDKAGVSRVTFYRNFKDKIEIIEGYFTNGIRNFMYNMGTHHSSDSYHEIAYQTFYYLKDNKDNMIALINNNLAYMYLNLLNDKFTANFIKDGNGSALNAHIFAGALFNLSMWWVKDDNCKTDIEILVNEYFKICNFNIKGD